MTPTQTQERFSDGNVAASFKKRKQEPVTQGPGQRQTDNDAHSHTRLGKAGPDQARHASTESCTLSQTSALHCKPLREGQVDRQHGQHPQLQRSSNSMKTTRRYQRSCHCCWKNRRSCWCPSSPRHRRPPQQHLPVPEHLPHLTPRDQRPAQQPRCERAVGSTWLFGDDEPELTCGE